jgi:hypothetical protein
MGDQDILVSYSLAWESLDANVTNTIFSVEEEEVQANVTLHVDGYTFIHHTNTSAEAALLTVDYSMGCATAQIYFTSDDWKLPWIMFLPYEPHYSNNIWASYTTGYGWYILASGNTGCSMTMRDVPTTLITLNSDPVAKPALLLEREGASNVGLIHVKVSRNVTAVRLDFSETVDEVLGCAHQMPFKYLVGYYANLNFDHVSFYTSSYKYYIGSFF